MCSTAPRSTKPPRGTCGRNHRRSAHSAVSAAVIWSGGRSSTDTLRHGRLRTLRRGSPRSSRRRTPPDRPRGEASVRRKTLYGARGGVASRQAHSGSWAKWRTRPGGARRSPGLGAACSGSAASAPAAAAGTRRLVVAQRGGDRRRRTAADKVRGRRRRGRRRQRAANHPRRAPAPPLQPARPPQHPPPAAMGAAAERAPERKFSNWAGNRTGAGNTPDDCCIFP